MLLRLVGTADSAGDCEKTGVGSLGAPNNLTQANVSQMDTSSLVFRYVPVEASDVDGVVIGAVSLDGSIAV